MSKAIELVEEPVSEDLKPVEDISNALIADEGPVEHPLNHDEPPVDLGALVAKVIPQELSHCSDEQLTHLQDQLIQLQDQLLGKMRSVVREQQARLHQRSSNA